MRPAPAEDTAREAEEERAFAEEAADHQASTVEAVQDNLDYLGRSEACLDSLDYFASPTACSCTVEAIVDSQPMDDYLVWPTPNRLEEVTQVESFPSQMGHRACEHWGVEPVLSPALSYILPVVHCYSRRRVSAIDPPHSHRD